VSGEAAGSQMPALMTASPSATGGIALVSVDFDPYRFALPPATRIAEGTRRGSRRNV